MKKLILITLATIAIMLLVGEKTDEINFLQFILIKVLSFSYLYILAKANN